MKKILLILTLVAAVTCTHANVVSLNTAKTVGYNYLLQYGTQGISAADELQLIYTMGESTPYLYVLSTENCFVIVSADDRVRFPVLGYSTSRPFGAGERPDGLQFMLDWYSKQIEHIVESGNEQSEEAKYKWMALVEPASNAAHRTTSGPIVCPMLRSEWEQGPIFWCTSCPLGQPAGCVATAMSQVMYYWGWPRSGIGYNSYIDPFISFTIPFPAFLETDLMAHPFNWAAMKGSEASSYAPTYTPCPTRTLTVPSPGAEWAAMSDAVSTLQYQVGLSVGMQYNFLGSWGSAALPSTAADRLRDNFLYSSDFSFRPFTWIFDEAPWLNRINDDLNAGRPVIYSGTGTSLSGHTWVIDGYNADGFYNMNWGWGGSHEGIFTLNTLDPDGTGDMDFMQSAIFEIAPKCPSDIVFRSTSSSIAGVQSHIHGGVYMGSAYGGSGMMYNDAGINQWVAGRWVEVREDFEARPATDGSTFFEMGVTGCPDVSGREPFGTLSLGQANGDLPADTRKTIDDHKTIREISNKHEIVVFPNPATDEVTISFPCLQSGQLAIIIKDVSGRTMLARTIPCRSGSDIRQVMDIRTLVPGVYSLDLTLNDQHTVKKIVKI